MEALTDEELLTLWDMETDLDERDKLIKVMQSRNLFPQIDQKKWEDVSGAYPSFNDPEFLYKLMERREFAESQGQTMSCDTKIATDEFQLSPTQRFVANFLSPRTPYMSALLYHGVGVGKTCSAVQIAEQFLHLYPNQSVTILAPPTIKANFEREIFDIDKVKIGVGENEPNSALFCTGTIYMELTNTLYERNKDIIRSKVNRKIRKRYNIIGYGVFANELESDLSSISEKYSPQQREDLERRMLQDKFSGKLLIIDEVHNLRDTSNEAVLPTDSDQGSELGPIERDEIAGKKLTPYLTKLLRAVDGLKLVMMSATPMYNTYKEIVFLMNLILMNEKKAELIESDIFFPDGTFREKGQEILGALAQHYVSYMRGENPDLFPLRLKPQKTLTNYPLQNPRGSVLSSRDRIFIEHLGLVPVELSEDIADIQRDILDNLGLVKTDDISLQDLDLLTKSAMCLVPPVEDEDIGIRDRIDKGALNLHFYKQTVGGERTWKSKGPGHAAWLALPEFRRWAPKFAKIIETCQNAEGISFIYSRFVNMGCQIVALALEANGYTQYGRRLPLLGDGIQAPGGRQCARCPLKEKAHKDADHEFAPAYYCLLTADKKLTPDKRSVISAVRREENKEGEIVKVIIGSDVVSEGVDFRFIREIHVIEPWYHLNNLEQIIGRGIRTASHCLLPLEKRNCTVYLYVNQINGDQRETADMYLYRKAYRKARQVGAVSRVLKMYAVDCNINHDAIIIDDREPRTIINSQREVLKDVDINDQPYTAICDWLDTCDYSCVPSISVQVDDASEISYSEYSARWREAEMKRVIRAIFSQPGVVDIPQESMATLLGRYPRIARLALLAQIKNNPAFVVVNNGREGYIIYRNGFYMFQPFVYSSFKIPRAVRLASYPLRQDSYSPEFLDALKQYEEANHETDEIVEKVDDGETRLSKLDIGAMKTMITNLVEELRKYAQKLAISDTVLPDEIYDWLKKKSGNDKNEYERRRNRMKMIRWIAQSLREAKLADPVILERLILEFFWDEEMDLNEQVGFYAISELNELGKQIAPSQFYAGKSLIFMHINPRDGSIYYMCDTTGKSCSPAIIELITETVPLNKMIVDTSNTGFFYGLIVNDGSKGLVFKTRKPSEAGSAEALKRHITRAAKCSGVSTSSHHLALIVDLGNRLLEGGYSNLGLTKDNLSKGPRQYKNTQEICALQDLVLRYMDIIGFENKRWFYRPIEAAMTGHKGT